MKYTPEDHRRLAFNQIAEAFEARLEPDTITTINNPLAWQEKMDNAPASINMLGAARFWKTVAALLGKQCYTDGSPDCACVVIELTPEIGLQLTADYNKYVAGPKEGQPVLDDDWAVWMDYRFVSLDGP